jgi:hypothetical protein
MTTFVTEDVLNAMDASRLADLMDEGPLVPRSVAAKMLRMQYEKIADLQTTIKFLEEETKALRKQLISATNAVMELRR